ncbi:hypothetical protein ACOMHN_062569 [Nucella lapillus]
MTGALLPPPPSRLAHGALRAGLSVTSTQGRVAGTPLVTLHWLSGAHQRDEARTHCVVIQTARHVVHAVGQTRADRRDCLTTLETRRASLRQGQRVAEGDNPAVLWHGVSPGGAVARCVTRRCCGTVFHQAVLWHSVSPGGAVAWCVTRWCCGMVCHQAVLWHGVSPGGAVAWCVPQVTRQLVDLQNTSPLSQETCRTHHLSHRRPAEHITSLTGDLQNTSPLSQETCRTHHLSHRRPAEHITSHRRPAEHITSLTGDMQNTSPLSQETCRTHHLSHRRPAEHINSQTHTGKLQNTSPLTQETCRTHHLSHMRPAEHITSLTGDLQNTTHL